MHTDVNDANDQREKQESKPKATIGKIQQQQETYREKQLKAREEREERRNNLSSTHHYVIDFVANLLNIAEDVVEEGILDSPTYINLLNSLFSADGCRAVIFHYLEADYPPLESGRIAISTPRDLRIKRVILSNGTDIGIKGEIVLCYRTDNSIELDTKDVEELCFTYLGDVADAPFSSLELIHFFINQVSRPTVSNYFFWSEAKKIREIETIKPKLLNGYNSFINFLSATKSNLEDRVILSMPVELEKMRVNTHQAIIEASKNPQILTKIEETMHIWGKEIEKVLTKNDLIRRETADAGPLSELEHWRKLSTKLGSIVEQINSPICVGFSLCLQYTKAKYFKTWKGLKNKTTVSYNEAYDNMKYLSAMEKYCLPLYSNDPLKIKRCLPCLMHVIKMIHSNSKCYNTNERITALFVKVTNQILISCINYLTYDGKLKIWEQKKRLVIEKMEVCLQLYQHYYSCYQGMLKKMREDPDEKCFECSEMYIFGKFETFKTRLERLIDVLQTFLEYSILQSSCIEGIQAFTKRFLDIQRSISSKTYDALDHRKPYFDQDYLEIKRTIGDVEKDLRNFVQFQLSLAPDIHEALRLFRRFEKLNLSSLELESQYSYLVEKILKEIEMVRYRYNDEKKDPPIPRYFPPIHGRIMWARNYFKRLEEPMEVLKAKGGVFEDAKGRKAVLLYNSLAMILVHYETLYHHAWCKEAYKVRDRLKSPILVYNPNNKRTYINYDRYVREVIHETEGMWKLKLEVPYDAQVLTYQKNHLMGRIEKVKALLEINDRLRTKTEPVYTREQQGILEQLGVIEEDLSEKDDGLPELFDPLIKPEFDKIDDALKPGLCVITWTSVNLDEFCLNLKNVLNEVDIFLKEVKDLIKARIDQRFKEIAETKLVYLPLDETLTISNLISENLIHQGKTIKELSIKSQAAEEATMELIDLFLSRVNMGEDDELKYQWMNSKLPSITTPRSVTYSDHPSRTESEQSYRKSELRTLHQNCLNLFIFFSNKFLEALVKATRLSLDLLRKRTSHLILHKQGNEDDVVPLIETDMVLQLPNITIQPTLEEIQLEINNLVSVILKTHKGVIQWGQIKVADEREEIPLPFNGVEEKPSKSGSSTSVGLSKIRNCFRSVAEHKETLRYLVMLQGHILSLKTDVTNLCKSYFHYSFLWNEEREREIKDFVESKPIMAVIFEEFQKYENLVEEVNNLPEFHCVGPLKIFTRKFKLGLTVEISAWKNLLGRHLSNYYREILCELVTYFEEKSEILQKPIKDLEDVRSAMLCLEDIRDNFIRIDMTLGPLEEVYSIFNKFGVIVPQEDIDNVDSISYSFQKLLECSVSVQEDLGTIQEPFKQELIDSVSQFQEDVIEFDKDFIENGPMVEGIPAREASDRLILFQARFDDLWQKYETYSGGEKLFGLPINEYPALMQRKKELNFLQKLYGLYNTVMRIIDGYYDLFWTDVDIEAINYELLDLQLRCRKLPKGLKEWPAYLDLTKKIDDFKETCPLLELMSNKAMKERHWERIAAVTKHKFDIESENFTLGNVMEAPLLKYKDEVEDICIGAVKERDIEAKLKQVIVDWSGVSLQFSNFKSRGELLLKGQESQEIIVSLEDSIMVLGSLLSNRYNIPFKKTIQLWLNNLSNTSEILENWLVVQNLWIYLEAVFVGGDISKQLPAEARRFKGIDRTWVTIMERAHGRPNVIDCCVGDDTMTQLLPHLLEQLETCQKSLTGYLESKRLLFPRFFFVSDPALLEILGQASDSHSIQAHLLAIFDNVATVEFHEKEYDKIMAVLSRENEKITLIKSVMCTGSVEVWLNTLLQSQQSSLHSVIQDMAYSLSEPEFNVLDMINSYPAQVGLLGIQMIWTRDAENALHSAKIDKNLMKATNEKFLDLLNLLIEQTTKNLTKFERTKFETLVTIHVHQRDIFDDLCTLKVRSASDFEWLKQARFYFDEDADVTLVKITDVDFIYQNEFLGCTERLVITPLTDRCYITLAQAIGMSMGGAPAGPAGTGKTETTKDMGKALGKYVVVFNCSDQMDFRGLGRIYKGLAQSGSWGCFDEFNRIELPVLSVAAQQINIVLTAKKERKKSFIFSDGDKVSLNPEFGIFITMNPGYAGRQELPENLKIMFRTVAMMVPDRQIIMRVKLASCGFKDNINLARKFFTLYKLCEEQLSKQVHYDFGLRNILSVLRTLGAQKRTHPGETEETIVMRVLRDMNMSKLVDEDEPLFHSLIEDLFPGIKLTVATYDTLQFAINHQVNEAGLINHPSWNLKVIQLYETSLVRHGLMVMGPTGAGKTSCIHILMKALTEIGLPHKEIRMNPKAITAPQMFGRLDVATNDWTDGIFSTLWRKTLKVKKTENVWLVLDGPVDAVWIENLNSVLDDNKTLTLANGDRIVMASNSKILFEPDNVDNASPATVSRMGMVFMSSSVLIWEPIVKGWLKTRSHQELYILDDLFHQIFHDICTFVRIKLCPKMKILECMYVKQCGDLLDGLIPTHDTGENSCYHLEHLFLFALMWSFGALLELDDRSKLEEFVRNHPSKLKWPKTKPTETMFEYMVNTEGDWEHWNHHVPEFVYPPDSVPEFSSILVPNVDNIRTAFLINLIAKQSKAVLLIGEQGTAKTVMVKSYMSSYDPEFHLSKSFNFSSATTPNMFQRVIESYVEKRMGTTYGPSSGRKMTVFIDDINMPIVNEWGDQVTNEIVRQLMESRGFYSLDKPGEFTNIVDMQFLASMIHPGGGRNDIPPRLKRQFNIFNCTLPSNTSIDKIFGVIAEGYFCPSRFNEEVVSLVTMLVPLTRVLWQKVKVKMLPTPAKFHYIFNLRDLSRIWEGMLNIQNEECKNKSDFLNLWRHECSRVIADRFTNESDSEWFRNTLITTAEETLADDFEHFPKGETYFVDFLRDPPEPTGEEDEEVTLEPPKIYEEIPSFKFVTDKVLQYMAGYNESIRGANMDIVFFNDALVHLMKISRIIRTPRGNALLVGVGGSGKQSLARLATFIAGYKIFQITLTRSYNISNLMDDLKYLYRVSGFEGKCITFLFTENEIKDEAFLEYLNNVLSSGEVANLFAKDEIDEIQSELIPIMKKIQPKVSPTNDNVYSFFISRARSNLHCVLCFSPVGEKFRSRALKFPGLISGCTIDWFSRWPRDALVAVAQHFLQDFPISCTPEVKIQVIEMMADIQDGVFEKCTLYFERYRRQNHVTPKSYLTFLNAYKNTYLEKYDHIAMLSNRMSTGLSKLEEAEKNVDELCEELKVKREIIAEATIALEKVLIELTATAEAAEKMKAEVQIQKDKAQLLVDEIAIVRAAAQEKLEAALPALKAAEAALMTIKAIDIATVRKLPNPPYLITLIMDAVLILFQKHLDPVKPDRDRQFLKPSWNESLKVMADNKFLSYLQNFPRDKINGETVDLLQPYLGYHSYNYESAKQACGNVGGLIQWTISMNAFYAINKEVLPLKLNLELQESKLAQATRELNRAQAILDEKQRELDIAQAKFDKAMAEKQALMDDAQRLQDKMEAAMKLIEGLKEERERWKIQSLLFKSMIEMLVGDVVLLTGFLSYLGPFNQEYRELLNKSWEEELLAREIPASNKINIIENLVDTATIGEWNLQGLPSDDLSIENGIIVTKADRYPLLIDPQIQGKQWILNKEKNNDLCVTSLNHKYFRNHLEDSISIGRPLLIEDIGAELDPILDHILEKNFIKSGLGFKVRVGDKEVDVNKGFRLYITTKLPNPSYTPELSARASIIDFTVTMKGLENQLLGRVILTEKKELETERVNLIQEVTNNKRKMQELEDNLLYKLTAVQGSLVDDVTVIQVLNTNKAISIQVAEKLKIAAETEVKINKAREEFRQVAVQGSVLYFLICEMSMVNFMYQTSLVQFLEIFDLSMFRSTKSPLPAKRSDYIIDYLTYEVYRYTSRGLYESHKYLFTLLMTLKIDMQRGNVSHQEFEMFIKGGAALDLKGCQEKTAKWISDTTWLNLIKLSSLPGFEDLPAKVLANEKQWKNWFDKEAPEEVPAPDDFDENLDVFGKTLFIRAWCPDRTIAQSRKYVASTMGQKYIEPVILNLEKMLQESRTDTPMICLLSMGSDPTNQIEGLAKKLGIIVNSISMGQGQEIHARRLLAESMDHGSWLLLQNCHLGLEYMSELVRSIISADNIHEQFRVWITTEVHPYFSISLLQQSIKFTNEPPQGIKAGLKRTYREMSQDMLEYSDYPQYKPVLYAISFLHTVVQERRKFGPLGWNIPYEFNSADWHASILFIQNHLDDIDIKRGVSWPTVRYMLGEVQYGGRVTDDYDKRLLNTFAKVWFGEHMFAEDFVFYKGYPIMNFHEIQHYMNAIDVMSTIDPPQVYGLSINADIIYQTNATICLLDTIVSIQPKESGIGGGESREVVVKRLAEDMLEKLPEDYDPHFVKERLNLMGAMNSMNIFLRQEIDRMQRVITLVRSTLSELLLAIEGTIIMNENLRDALDNFYNARVPEMWKKNSWISSSLGFWFTELIDRNNQFTLWINVSRPNAFWMTGFFNPQGFLTAMRQEVTRAHKGWALDSVTIHSDITKYDKDEVKRPPQQGVYVYGLYLDGAAWDKKNKRLIESVPKVLFANLPVVHIFAVNSTSPKDPKLYECPVYKKPDRTDLNFITPLWLPTIKPPEHWILRGVAMLCDIK